MPSKQCSAGLIVLLTMAAAAFLAITTHASAQAEGVLHSFDNNGTDGYAPYAGLVADSAGNLYGTTGSGGIYNGGTAFELSPRAGGGWAETVLYSFGNSGDGAFPSGGLILDAAGNLYGAASQKGADGGGIVFKLSPLTGSNWQETVLHAFGSGTDGANPGGNLVFDSAGNLYGTTRQGGTGNCGGSAAVCGTVYELTPATTGSWTETVVYNFDFTSPAGFNPNGGLVLDKTGNLYGTTSTGGQSYCGCGTVFELKRGTKGSWATGVLHSFRNSGTDGFNPNGGLIIDAAGNLYGTTGRGGNTTNCGNGESCGTVFVLVRSVRWAETILHNFSNNGKDGTVPQSSLIFGPAGNLYGTTVGGGAYNEGTVFELKP